MAHTHWRRLGMMLGGVAAGTLVAALVAYLYFQRVTDFRIAEGVLRAIDLPADAFEVQDVEGDSIAVVAVDDVLIRSEGGDTVVAAPTAEMRIRLTSLSGDGPIVLDQVRLQRAFVNLVQDADGEMNLSRVMVVSAGGQDLGGDDAGRPIELRDVRLSDARVRVLTPYAADSAASPAALEDIRLVRMGGVEMRERWARDVEASLPVVRFGGDAGWRVEVGALSATLTDPEVQVANLAGSAQGGSDGVIGFAVREFRTPASTLTAAGTVRFADAGLVFDVDASAAPVAFSDLRWVVPTLPDDGVATGQFSFRGDGGGRVAVTGQGVEVTARESLLTGYFSAEVGGDRPATFGETRVAFEPLRIETVRSFGIGADLPYVGEIRGVVSSAGGAAGGAELFLDLIASVAPESGQASLSSLSIQGPLEIGEEMQVRFAGVRVSAQPLYLAALRPLVETDPERLRGVVQAAFLLNGTLQDLRIDEGSVAYQVGDAPASALTELSGVVRMDPELSFDISANAQPLSLATIAEVFPAMPFRTARFAGPLRVAGTMQQFSVDAELAGSAGTIAARGVINPGTPLRFDISGDVSAFNADAVLTRSVPLEGPVTGSFAAAGTATAFDFNVDLLQEGADPGGPGSFVLAGTFRGGSTDPALIQVAGDVSNFNLGAVIGRPNLFPSRMSGRVELNGGGTAPYTFDVDLRGEAGIFDLAGFFAPGAVPSYAASGQITGLDIRLLPGLQMLPSTDLRGTLSLEGRGTSLETLAGELRFSAEGSSVGGQRLDRFDVDLAVVDGVLEVDTLAASLAGTQLNAGGRVGLTRQVAGDPLRFRAVSSDVGRLAPLATGIRGLPPRLTGSFLMQGELTGSIQAPVITTVFRGQDLRYEAWRADRLEIDADLAIASGFQEVQGRVEVAGANLASPAMTLDSLRLALDGTQDSMTVRLVLSPEEGNDIQLTGAMELEGRTPRGILFDSLAVRAGDLAWRLDAPAAVRWGGVDGIQVSNLFLRSVGDSAGTILVDGNLPPSGTADLRAEVRRLDLALIQRLVPNSPDLAGVVDLDLLLQGPTSDPELLLQGYGTGVRYEGVALDSLSLNADYDDRRLVARTSLWRGALRVASGEAEIPMLLSIDGAVPSFELLRTLPVRASLQADSLPIALLTAGTAEITDGEGTIIGQLDLSGTVASPELSGYATVQNGAITAPELGRRFERISGHFILDEQQVLIDSLVVWSGGRGEVNGSVRMTDLERPELYLSASFESFHAIDNDEIANLTMSGDVRLEGIMPEPVLSGSVRLQEGALYIPSLDEQAPLEITDIEVGQVGADTAVAAVVGPSMLERMRINSLDVVVDEGVWLESDEAHVQISGQLVVLRTGPAIQMYGTLQAVRGTYNLPIGPLFREFEVVSGSVRFLGTPDFNPTIDITAEHDVQAGTSGGAGSLAILVHLTGTLENPSIALSSNTRPPLPESELLSYLMFGQPSFRLNQGTSALANQLIVQDLLGGLLTRQLGDLGLPCDYFRLRGRPNIGTRDPLGATSVECGFELLEDVFFTVETGVLPSLNGGSGALLGALLGVSLDWQVNDRVTATLAREPVQSPLGTLLLTPANVPYQLSADVRGTWEFGRPAESDLPAPDLENLPIESAPPATPAAPVVEQPAEEPVEQEPVVEPP